MTRSMRIWLAKRSRQRYAPPGGWKAYLRAADSRVDWRMRYAKYLKSEAWRLKRQGVLRRSQGICVVCGSTRYIQVHHTTYVNVGLEAVADLRAICRDCHRRYHAGERFAIPLDRGTLALVRDRRTRAASR